MRRLLLGIAVALGTGGTLRGDDPVPEKDLREAVTRALPLLAKGAAGHRRERTCFACHNQAIPILALTTAGKRGLAIDADDRVLLVRQYRVAVGEALLEVPAGTLDVAADGAIEDPDLAARRELEEETGMRAATWRTIATFNTAPGFASEKMFLYLATDLVPADEDRLGPDEDERLLLERVPWRDAVAAAERGEIRDAKSLIALLWLARLVSD